MSETKVKRDWTPVRKGETYCSPACGCNCTQAAYELAHLRAERLAARLNKMKDGFSDWHVKVFENCGWHYRVYREIEGVDLPHHQKNQCEMWEYHHADGTRSYWCDAYIAGRQFCNTPNQHTEAKTTPESALREVMQMITSHKNAFLSSMNKFKAQNEYR